MRELPPRPRRAYADGSVDGDDIWPTDLTDADLAAIAAVDRRIQSQEGDRNRPSFVADMIGEGPMYSVAERIRHWRDLVEGLEHGHVNSAGEYGTELGCRSIVEDHLAGMPDDVHAKLMREVVGPLDVRFEAMTVDDAGTELASHMRLGESPSAEWWWRRRPTTLGEYWNPDRSHRAPDPGQ